MSGTADRDGNDASVPRKPKPVTYLEQQQGALWRNFEPFEITPPSASCATYAGVLDETIELKSVDEKERADLREDLVNLKSGTVRRLGELRDWLHAWETYSQLHCAPADNGAAEAARKAAQEAAARVAAEQARKEKEEAERKAEEEAERKRKAAAEEEAKRKAAAEEAKRKAAEEAKRKAAEEEAKREAAAAAAAAEAEAKRKAAAAEAVRLAAEEASRKKAQEEEEARKRAEVEAKRAAALAAEEESKRKAAEAEAQNRKAEEEARQVKEARRKEAEAQETARKLAEEEAAAKARAETAALAQKAQVKKEEPAADASPQRGQTSSVAAAATSPTTSAVSHADDDSKPDAPSGGSIVERKRRKGTLETQSRDSPPVPIPTGRQRGARNTMGKKDILSPQQDTTPTRRGRPPVDKDDEAPRKKQRAATQRRWSADCEIVDVDTHDGDDAISRSAAQEGSAWSGGGGAAATRSTVSSESDNVSSRRSRLRDSESEKTDGAVTGGPGNVIKVDMKKVKEEEERRKKKEKEKKDKKRKTTKDDEEEDEEKKQARERPSDVMLPSYQGKGDGYRDGTIFWTQLEQNFQPIRGEHLRLLDLTNLRHGDSLLEIPSLGPHWKKKWAAADMRVELDGRGSGSTIRIKPGLDDAGGKKQKNLDAAWNNKDSLSQRILAALVQEKVLLDSDFATQFQDPQAVDGPERHVLAHPERSVLRQKPSLEERLKKELRSIGLIDDTDADLSKREDDEVCAELRFLQMQLLDQVRINNERRKRTLEKGKQVQQEDEVLIKKKASDRETEKNYNRKKFHWKKKRKAKGKQFVLSDATAAGLEHYSSTGPDN